MNREIIFRGKSIGTGEWLYGHLFKLSGQWLSLAGGRFGGEV